MAIDKMLKSTFMRERERDQERERGGKERECVHERVENDKIKTSLFGIKKTRPAMKEQTGKLERIKWQKSV